jgi:hypothetical protein
LDYFLRTLDFGPISKVWPMIHHLWILAFRPWIALLWSLDLGLWTDFKSLARGRQSRPRAGGGVGVKRPSIGLCARYHHFRKVRLAQMRLHITKQPVVAKRPFTLMNSSFFRSMAAVMVLTLSSSPVFVPLYTLWEQLLYVYVNATWMPKTDDCYIFVTS